MTGLRPERLNLAIARRCFVTCRGCYQFFGRSEPELDAFEASVAVFVRLGVTAVTISGGDPLTLPGLTTFLTRLRTVGVTDIKVDTVGTSMLERGHVGSSVTIRRQKLQNLLGAVDFLGLPLDGWSNESLGLFRVGRPELYRETVALLDAIDTCSTPSPVVVNTVVHRHNVIGLGRMLEEVSRHRSVTHWNLFQYTPTDQVAGDTNRDFSLEETVFADASAKLLAVADRLPVARRRFGIGVHTVRSRLGQYLLINSDGECWLPDARGRSVRLGAVRGSEEAVMKAWAEAVRHVRAEPASGALPQSSAHVPRIAEVA